MTDERHAAPAEGWCPACDREVLLIRKPLYDGFHRVGDTVACSACGHVFTGDERPASTRPAPPRVFTEADRTNVMDPFAGDERGHLCRYCRHYVVNPFRQWCGLHRRDVEATDTCPQFDPRPAHEEGPNGKKPPL